MEPGLEPLASLEQLEALLAHTFARRELLVQALTHSSVAHERQAAGESPELPPVLTDNEQLEFLGDAVVGLLVTEALFRRFPELHEGELTRLRAALVSRRHLGHVAAKLDLGTYLVLGRSEERNGGRKKPALLANCIEAVIAALYLDAGIAPTSAFVEQQVVEPYAPALRGEMEQGNAIGDHKSALQEYLQAHKMGQPEYIMKAESGPDHRKRFLVEVRATGSEKAGSDKPVGKKQARVLARGIGGTKKRAEQEAARRAMEKLRAATKREGAPE